MDRRKKTAEFERLYVGTCIVVKILFHIKETEKKSLIFGQKYLEIHSESRIFSFASIKLV